VYLVRSCVSLYLCIREINVRYVKAKPAIQSAADYVYGHQPGQVNGIDGWPDPWTPGGTGSQKFMNDGL